MPLTVACGVLLLPRRWGGHRVPIRLHLLIIVLPVLSSLAVLVRGGSGLAFLLVLLATGPFGVLMVLVHECGHIAEASRHGCTPSHILLWPLGGLAVIAANGQSHRQHALIAAAGPATHVPMVLAWLALLACTGQLTLDTQSLRLDSAAGFFAALFAFQIQYNLLTLAFNLLVPCFPLDCSQIVVSLLCMRGWPKLRIAKLILGSSAVVLVLLGCYGLVGLLYGVPSAALGLFIAVWLGIQSRQLHAAYEAGEEALELYPLFRGGQETRQGGGGGGGLQPQPPAMGRVCAAAALVAAITVGGVPIL